MEAFRPSNERELKERKKMTRNGNIVGGRVDRFCQKELPISGCCTATTALSISIHHPAHTRVYCSAACTLHAATTKERTSQRIHTPFGSPPPIQTSRTLYLAPPPRTRACMLFRYLYDATTQRLHIVNNAHTVRFATTDSDFSHSPSPPMDGLGFHHLQPVPKNTRTQASRSLTTLLPCFCVPQQQQQQQKSK